jgi:HAD superfamily hydrolase (TIGR01509 family)
MKKTIILDMDGTMVDSEPLWGKSFIKTGIDLGYDFTKELHTKTIGLNSSNLEKLLKEELGKDFPFDVFIDKYVENTKEIIDKEGLSTKKGLRELLDYLITNNYDIAIASSSSLKMIKNNLKRTNIDESIFKVIVSGEDFVNGKPNPEIFLKTCELLNTTPEETIVIEDSNSGIKAAYSAGCIPILIPDVDKITEDTLQMTKYKLNSLNEVISILEIKSK